MKPRKESLRSVPPALDPGVVARAGLDLLDRVGFDDFSMRRLAAALGVQNPALYWHFRDKQELVDRMAQALLASGFAPDEALPEPASWEERLLRFARSLRRAMHSRRDGARLIAAADLSQGDELLGRLDRTVAALVIDGFRGPEALGGVLTLIHYTGGEAFEEQTDPRPDAPTLTKARARQLPALAAVLAEMGTAPTRPDARFELGIRLILEGIRACYAPAAPRSKGRVREGRSK